VLACDFGVKGNNRIVMKFCIRLATFFYYFPENQLPEFHPLLRTLADLGSVIGLSYKYCEQGEVSAHHSRAQ